MSQLDVVRTDPPDARPHQHPETPRFLCRLDALTVLDPGAHEPFAAVAEVSVTETTLDVTAAASGLDAKAPIADVNCEPFCSS